MKKFIHFAILLITILSFKFSNAQQTIILNPVQDAYFLSFGGGQGGNALLKFDISSIPVGASISSVTLEVYVADTINAMFLGPVLGNMIFKNLNVQGWLESDSAALYDPSAPMAPIFTDSTFQLANFGDSIGWASSVDLSAILLRDYNASNNFCTVYMKDPDDMTCCGAFGPGFTPFLGNLQDSIVVGNSIGGADQIIFYPREYTNTMLIPKLIINYSLGLEITEIMYNPPEAGVDTLEFIEIVNSGVSPVDVTNFTITGVTYTFPSAIIAPGQHYVIAVNSGAFNNVYGFAPDGQFGGGLNNNGEFLTIKDAVGNLVDSVFFDDSGVWPSGAAAGQPDGGGSSLILCDVNTDNNDGANWSKCVFQTGVIINGFEVLASPDLVNFCCPILNGIDVQTACDSLLWIDGNTYYANNNTATFTVKNATNCDSTITLNLTINTVDNSITQVNDSLTANQTGASYQWLDCNNGYSEIIGEINQLYIATINGDYAVVVTFNGCTDTSICANILITSINKINSSTINIFPNPANNVINISLGEVNVAFNFTLTSIDGKVVYQEKNVIDKTTAIDISNYSKGVYFLKVDNVNDYKVFKVIKQ